MEASLKIHSGIDSSMEDPLSIVSRQLEYIIHDYLYVYIYIYVRYSTALEKSFFQNLEVSEEPNSVKLVKIGLFLKRISKITSAACNVR